MPKYVIPLFDEIRASLSPPDASATVVRVGKHAAVKFGARILLLEAENLRYVSENSDVPVPKVFTTMTEPETGYSFIVMEYVNGQRLDAIWESLTSEEKHDIGKQTQTALEDLRKIPIPGYFGALDRQPFPDGVFWTQERNPETSGPVPRRPAEADSRSKSSIGKTLAGIPSTGNSATVPSLAASDHSG
ncbi:Putative protein kinase-like domain superfamily [Colletotrichum destructivum]|uniref:Aminoglycoside phosphotransferase domain-containing protein n=1 Tax=Colletotrichum destructivum TaxID=34406 RepID=A0AAX4HWI3_9PEZI|nr:Putative protein kinase-like domain superfamily [Colletotrichum destructivum]